MEKNVSYNKAVAEIEAILKQFDEEDFDVDTLAGKVDRATQLIKLCQTKLTKAEEDVQRILKDEQ